ncbi:MAG: ATP-grasp domain-containing protein [Sinobacteraceae bacterium]|nr:ATP-grasp domain-containing protein [Nevskiaceae bacterium]
MSRATPFHKILIANRSEIAVRIARTARELGYRTVAVYSDIDVDAVHVAACDEAMHIGGTAAQQSYLNIDNLLAAARRSGADAVHPGYGFLAENASFAAACRDAGLVFIGPSPEAIAAMGDKARAKQRMREVGIPCIPGYDGDAQDDAALAAEAQKIGYPLMIKASAGGGGRGIRRVISPGEFSVALKSARSEAQTAFGDSRIILEKIIAAPRHVEIQVFGDRYGRLIHLGERDCSVQRRYQKVVEEAPSPAVNANLRETMGQAALRAAETLHYEGAGTVEFLLDSDQRFYFMEMNTRLQVEHTVTEEITGLDLVELQLRVAAGEPLGIEQKDIHYTGHAIQVRVCSEDPQENFLPQGGRMHAWQPPRGIRVEHALKNGVLIASNYDSMIAKLIAKGRHRDDARRRLILALEDLVALGPPTNQSFLAQCLRHPVFASGAATTSFIDDAIDELTIVPESQRRCAAIIAAVLLASAGERRKTARATADGLLSRHPTRWELELDGALVAATLHSLTPHTTEVRLEGHTQRVTLRSIDADLSRFDIEGHCFDVPYVFTEGELQFRLSGQVHRAHDRSHHSVMREEGSHDGRIHAYMAGRVVAVHAHAGENVSRGQALVTIEAMKIEHTHMAPTDGTLAAVLVETNQQVTLRQVLAEVSTQATA